MEERLWEIPSLTIQDVLEEIKENTRAIEYEVNKLVQYLKLLNERGNSKDFTELGQSFTRRTLKRPKSRKAPLKMFKSYTSLKDLDWNVLRKEIKKERMRESFPKEESFLNVKWADLGVKEPERVNLYLDKVPMSSVIRDEEKELQSDLVDSYMKLQAERLLYKETYKKPETLVGAITLTDNLNDLFDTMDQMEKDEERGYSMTYDDERKVEDEMSKVSAESESDLSYTANDKIDFFKFFEDQDRFQEEDDISVSSEERKSDDSEANEALKAAIESLKDAIDKPDANIEPDDFSPEIILRLLFASKIALKKLELENSCFEIFLIKNAPKLLLRSGLTAPRHHRFNRTGRLIIKKLYKHKLIKPKKSEKKKKKTPKWMKDDDRSISTDSTDVSSTYESFAFLETKKLIVINATKDLRKLANLLADDMNEKFIKAIGVRHELFCHHIDIAHQEKEFDKVSQKETHHFPQVMYLFWKRWLLRSLQDLIFMETRGRLISKSINSMKRLKKHFDYLESITQYGDKLHEQVFYDTVSQEYNTVSDGVYDLRKAIANLLNEIFVSYHKIDSKVKEYNKIKDEYDSIQAQIKTCNRIRRREKEKYNKIKSLLESSTSEPKKASVFKANENQDVPNLKLYTKLKMKNNFTRHALDKLLALVRNQEQKVRSLTDKSAPVNYTVIKRKKLKGFESLLKIVKRNFEDTKMPSTASIKTSKRKRTVKKKFRKLNRKS